MASVLGNWLAIDIRVRPSPIAWIVTSAWLPASVSFGEPSSLAKPSRKESRLGGSTSTTSQ